MISDTVLAKNGQFRTCGQSKVFLLGLLLITTWTLWYFWTSTVLPRLRPQHPKYLPYLVPIIGHAFAFFRDSGSVVEYGKHYFNDAERPFIIVVGKALAFVAAMLYRYDIQILEQGQVAKVQGGGDVVGLPPPGLVLNNPIAGIGGAPGDVFIRVRAKAG